MADTIRETIGAAFVTLLGGVGKPAGLTIERGRVIAVDEAKVPHTNVFFIQENELDEELDAVLEYDLEIGVESTVKATSQSSDEELDPVLSWIHTALYADRRLGGLCQDVKLSRTQWERETFSEPWGRVLRVYRVKYHTTEADPETGAQ